MHHDEYLWANCCDQDVMIPGERFEESGGFFGGPDFACPDCGHNVELIDHGCDGFELKVVKRT